MAQHLSKKRRIVQATESHNARENAQPITSARILQDLMADYSGSGVRQFRDFLNRCSEGPDVKEDEATRNRGFLKAYLEAQSKNWRNDQADGTEESVAFVDVTQIWSYAFQNNSGHLLTFLPASLAILVRLCSYHEELRTYGTILIHSLLQQANLKIVYKCLGGNKDYHISPCLRLLVEMNRFNFGALCGQVHSSFDFTIKDLVKAFEVRGSTKNEIEDPTKPSIRTQAVRFFISFLQNGEPSVRNAMLGLKTWISAIFKHLKADSPAVVSELLDSLSKRVINEKEIPRATKTNVFNEWVLAHILSLYSRNELVKVSRGGKDDDKKVSELAHEFLLTVCTTPGNGICFLDQGWYPPGYAGVDEKRGAHKVYNRALASFASSVRPYADTSQLDLLLDIFKTCPEIIANHFLSNSPFGFEPKLTATWIGYCTFLSSVISLPVPRNFGSSKDLAVPPPASIIIENILPQPLSKVVMSKCLTHTNKLIKFLSTRLLITSFQKLGAVLEAIDAADASMYDPTGIWKNCRSNVVEEFCKRIPDIQSLGAKPESNGVLQSEAHSRLLAEYYSKIPEISFTGKFDINFALSELLSKDLNDDNKKGILLVEMGHLLRIATEIPDVKWWNKTPSMLHSPFVSILKLCCSSSSGGSLLQVYDLLQSFASKSYLFQDTTLCSPLEALIESLSAVTDKVTLEAILSMLDEVIARCIRGPFKYCDDFTELAMELWKDTPGREEVPPVSPFVMALAEQWKFFGKEISIQQKTNGAMWFIRFLDSCALLGENRQVIGALCERVSADTQEKDIQNLFMKAVEFFKNTEPAQIVPGKKTNLILGRYFSDGQEYVNPEVILEILQAVQNGKIEPSLFRLIILQKVCISIAKGSNDPVLNPNGPREVISHINDLMKYTVLQLNEKVASVEEAKITKIFLAKRAETLAELIGSLPETTWVWLDIFHGLVELMCATFGENDLISFEKARRALPIGILKVMEYVEKQYKTISEPDLRRVFALLILMKCCSDHFL
ncbi:ribosome 60S biogenesis N-terminal-domain-containing protein [Geopyxis carbonaria]|nr:ribosome 60S biogenesis N-terminal-domain-containing protein [Geopyxis carbonaria]